MNNLPTNVQLLVYGIGALVLLGAPALLFHLRYYTRALNASNKEFAENIVADIIKQTGWESRQTWIGDDTISFVYVIFGAGNPGREFLWARVSITTTTNTVVLEHSYEARREHHSAARLIVDALKRRGIEASASRTSSAWPKLNEKGVVALSYESSAHA